MANSFIITPRACANVASSNGLPSMDCMVSFAITVLGAMPPKAMLTLSMIQQFPSPPVFSSEGTSLIRIPLVTMLISSSLLLACLNGATYSNLSRTNGTSTRSITSASPFSTRLYPTKKSETGTCLLRIAPVAVGRLARTRVAPKEQSRGFMSEMGEAVARLPPRQATLRIWVDANHRSMSWIGVAVLLRRMDNTSEESLDAAAVAVM
mmetsp:Transcript_25851/g.55826  ORF Transcript_25851/g.55826 Transcript_25851/m.55826 type:complete len:208 (-) Transcript_25851:1688-2311(-)